MTFRFGISRRFESYDFEICYVALDRLCGLVSEFLATDTEVPGSIHGATRFSE
jgi:hypothetical protein